METLLANIGRIGIALLLLLCSGFFSGSETAFFNISPRTLANFKSSSAKLKQLAARLVSNPKNLLTCLLFSNMAVNVCYFSVSSVLTINFSRSLGPAWGMTIAVFSLLLLVIFGEMLPKSLALRNSAQLSVLAAVPCNILVKILGPIVSLLNLLIFEPILRLLGISGKSDKAVNPKQIISLIENIARNGQITGDENLLLGEIVEFGFLKVRNVMQPRVDMTAMPIDTPAKQAGKLMYENDIRFLPVYENNIDNIKGYIDARDLLLNPDEPVSNFIRPANFVPEQKSLESLLQFFHSEEISMAIAVDEYGGVAGRIDLFDVVKELVGTDDADENVKQIKQIGPMEYRLSGNLALHNLGEVFGIVPEQTKLSTIGGFTTALLGKIPSVGDTVNIKNVRLTVENVNRNRIETLIMSLTEDSNE